MAGAWWARSRRDEGRGVRSQGLFSHIRSLGHILGPVGGPNRIFNQRAVDQFVLKRDIELLVGSKERTLADCGNSQEDGGFD